MAIVSEQVSNVKRMFVIIEEVEINTGSEWERECSENVLMNEKLFGNTETIILNTVSKL